MFSLWQVTSIAVDAVSKLLQAQLRGDGAEGDNENAVPGDKATVFSQLGLVARPVVRATLRAIGYDHGDEVWILKMYDKSKQPSGVNAGDVVLFGIETPGATVWIRSSGKIEINAASGQDIVLNGGNLKVARDTDPVEVTIPIGTVVVAATGATLNPTPITLSGTIKNGALRLKA